MSSLSFMENIIVKFNTLLITHLNYTFDNYFIKPIKLINFKAIDEGSALLVSVLR